MKRIAATNVNWLRLAGIVGGLIGVVFAIMPGGLNAFAGDLWLPIGRALIFLYAVAVIGGRSLTHALMSMQPWQLTTLARVATLIAILSEAAWLFGALWCSDSGRCDSQPPWIALGTALLIAAVVAMWVATARSRTPLVPLLVFGGISTLGVYMMFGPPPG